MLTWTLALFDPSHQSTTQPAAQPRANPALSFLGEHENTDQSQYPKRGPFAVTLYKETQTSFFLFFLPAFHITFQLLNYTLKLPA